MNTITARDEQHLDESGTLFLALDLGADALEAGLHDGNGAGATDPDDSSAGLAPARDRDRPGKGPVWPKALFE